MILGYLKLAISCKKKLLPFAPVVRLALVIIHIASKHLDKRSKSTLMEKFHCLREGFGKRLIILLEFFVVNRNKSVTNRPKKISFMSYNIIFCALT